MEIEWRLRMVAATRDVWSGAELQRRLVERAGYRLSLSSVSNLLTKQPTELRIATLAALCTALGCSPDDLLVLRPDEPRVAASAGAARAADEGGASSVDRPVGWLATALSRSDAGGA